MPKKIKLGIIGGGGNSLIGVLHRVAAYINDNYEIVGGIFNSDFNQSLDFAKEIDLPTHRIYPDVDALILEENKLEKEEKMQAVCILTPNFLHFEMAKKLIDAGYHVICEKPMTTTYKEAVILQEALEKSKTVFALTHTYTGYPMVRQMREMIQSGMLGKIHKVDASYYQGWINTLIHDPAKRKSTWRLDPEKSGSSCCVGDIGVHAFNMIEFTTGLKVKSLLSDFNYLYSDNKMDIDASILVRFSDHVKGIIRSSQIATGEENGLTIAVYGDKGGLRWQQEDPNFLYFLTDDKPVQIYKPGHGYNTEISLDGTKLPAGHPEGIFDAMANIYKGAARAIRGEKYNSGEFPTIYDGVRGMEFIEKSVASNAKGGVWVEMES
ncbi:MAG: oxidoreductase [Flavobacteriaceae bacterium]|nr:MAG: oxidoreductase [Flavobacteriaceae bacterium]